MVAGARTMKPKARPLKGREKQGAGHGRAEGMAEPPGAVQVVSTLTPQRKGHEEPPAC